MMLALALLESFAFGISALLPAILLLAAVVTGRRNHGRSHSYLLDGQRVPSVTEILGKALAKPALTAWAAREAAMFLVDNRELFDKLQRDELVDLAKAAPFRSRDRAAHRGTEIHRLARALTEGEEVDVPPELVGHVDSHLEFLRVWQPRHDRLELPVYSRRWRYGGTADWFCEIEGLGVCLLDLKTNRSGPFGEVGLQLSAYGNAEFYLDEQGHEQPLPAIDWAGVLWVRADGCDLYQYDIGPGVDANGNPCGEFRQFLYLKEIARWLEERGDSRSMNAVKRPALPWPTRTEAVS